jgi:hypothetical protein
MVKHLLSRVKTALTVIKKAAERMTVCHEHHSYKCQYYHLYANPQCHNFPRQQIIQVRTEKIN